MDEITIEQLSNGIWLTLDEAASMSGFSTSLIKENLQVLNCEMRRLFGRYILVRKADIERIMEALSLVKEVGNEEKEGEND